jgi:6-phospho-3-hexuloisomerase
MTRFADNAATVAGEIARVLPRVDEAQVSALVVALTAARSVHVIGVGREGLAARAFTMRLAHAGLQSHWVWDDTTPAIGAGDVLVAVSGSGSIGHIDYVAGQAARHGATVSVVTANPAGTTAARADLLLVVPGAAYGAPDDVVPSVQPMGSLFEQSLLVTFDLVVLEVVATLGLSYPDLSSRHRNVE